MSLAIIFVSALAPAALAAVPPVPEAIEIEALCPGLAGNPLTFGTAEDAMPEAALTLFTERAKASGFEHQSPIYTAWSNRLVGIEYTQDVPGGEALGDWRKEFGDKLLAAGWEESVDGSMSLAAASFAKEFAMPDGVRTLTFDLDLHGSRRGITLRCSDSTMAFEAEEERNGILPPNSPRPLAPPAVPPLDDFLSRLDCTDPAVVELFARAESLDDAGALVEARLGPPGEIHAEANFRHRLVTWLRWRILASGQMDEEALSAIQERLAAQEPRNYEAELVELMGAVGSVMEAQDAQDAAGLCQSYRKVIPIMAEQSAEEARRDAALAAALEAEAVRRGIALD